VKKKDYRRISKLIRGAGRAEEKKKKAIEIPAGGDRDKRREEEGRKKREIGKA